MASNHKSSIRELFYYPDTGVSQYSTKDCKSKDQEKMIKDGDWIESKISDFSDAGQDTKFFRLFTPALHLEMQALATSLYCKVSNNLLELLGSFERLEKKPDEELINWFLTLKNRVEEETEKEIKKSDHGKLSLRGSFSIKEIEFYLVAEVCQRLILENFNNGGLSPAQNKLFHFAAKDFYSVFFKEKMNINIVRLCLRSRSGYLGTADNKKTTDKGPKRLIDPSKDLVDCEFIHFAIHGVWTNDEVLVPVCCVTFDLEVEIKARLSAYKSIAIWFIANLPGDSNLAVLQKELKTGRVLCLGPPKGPLKGTLIEADTLPLEDWVYEHSSDKAKAILDCFNGDLQP